jgi:hypothetical protein
MDCSVEGSKTSKSFYFHGLESILAHLEFEGLRDQPAISRIPCWGDRLTSLDVRRMPGLMTAFAGTTSASLPRCLFLATYASRYEPHRLRRANDDGHMS